MGAAAMHENAFRIASNLQMGFTSAAGGRVLTLRSPQRTFQIADPATADFVQRFIYPSTVQQVIDTLARSAAQRQVMEREIPHHVQALLRQGILEPVHADQGNPMETRSLAQLQNLACSQRFLVFGGADTLVRWTSAADFLQAAGLSDRNVVILRDHTRQAYQSGISQRLPSMGAVLGWLQGSAEAQPWIDKTYCLGPSLGGFMAVMAGYHLKVDEVWAFAPYPMRFDAPPGDRLGWDMEALLSRPNGVTRYNILYNPSHGPDVEVAERLSRLEGVHLLPQDGEGHLVFSHMVEQKTLHRLFPPFAGHRQQTTSDADVLEAFLGRPVQSERLLDELDSIGLINLVSFTERRYGVRLTLNDLLAAGRIRTRAQLNEAVGAGGPGPALSPQPQPQPPTRHRLRAGLVASFTAHTLQRPVTAAAASQGCELSLYTGPFGQLEQQLMPADSPLWAHRPEVLAIAMRLEDIDTWLATEAPQVQSERLAGHRSRLCGLVEAARKHTDAPIAVFRFRVPPMLQPTLSLSGSDGLAARVAAENTRLSEALSALPEVYLFDEPASDGDLGLWYAARAPASAVSMPRLGAALSQAILSLGLPRVKCIVVDLDNTLWGGVVGDDGWRNLKLDPHLPEQAFQDVQRALRDLRDRGYLLAIASKNDEDVALEAIRSHPDMVLRESDFSAMEIGWHPKALSLQRIAQRLNIGLDALIFIDDNPVERAAVRATLPEVAVVELPPSPADYLAAIRSMARLSHPRVSSTDRRRAAMYSEQEERSVSQQAAPSLDVFLRELQMEATVGLASATTLPRIHQLIQRTNQFNLTTRRHALPALQRMMASADHRVSWLRLQDRFGELGLVAVGILSRCGADWELDSFMMSCRVMGRGVETAFLGHLVSLARDQGAARIVGRYLPTARNHMVADFFTRHGFQAEDDAFILTDQPTLEADAIALRSEPPSGSP